MNFRIITYPFIAISFTFGIASVLQADTFPTPEVTLFESTSTGAGINPLVFDSLGTQNTAVVIENIVVNDSANPNFSRVYKACFEYGDYFTIFNTSRTDTPCRDDLSNPPYDFNIINGDAEFLGNQIEAGDAGGGLVPSMPSPDNPPVADGMLTALKNTFSSGSNIRRILGATVQGDQFFPTAANTSFFIPYAANEVADTVSVFTVSYSGTASGGAEWVRDNGNTIQDASGQAALFARFEQVGDPIDVTPPSPIELPEPTTIIGLLIVGTAGLITTRHR